MPMYPEDLRYSEEHEWARVLSEDEAIVEVGISHHAQDALGDVVFVELPTAGDKVAQFDKFGEIESVKAVSDLFSPVAGEIVEVNSSLESSPEVVNSDPYGEGWLLRVKVDGLDQLANLMDAATYTATLG